jgi:outer membrane receptor for ferrienterochelin and colicins
MYQPVKDYVLSLRFRHVGERNRPKSDPRPSLSGYDTVNFSAGVENLLRDGLTLRAGVKNLFDEDVRVPSSYPGYIDDYPMPGREWWIQVSYTF